MSDDPQDARHNERLLHGWYDELRRIAGIQAMYTKSPAEIDIVFLRQGEIDELAKGL